MAYTKLFSTIVTSTVWGEPHTTRIVWVTMLAIATKDGEVQSTIPGLARMANVTIGEAEDAITRFLTPDPYSRTPDDEGRRIESIEGGWHLLNYDKYRRMASYDEAKEKNADRQRRFRERAKRNGKNVTGNESNAESNAGVTHLLDKAEAEAEAEAEGKNKTLGEPATPFTPTTKKQRVKTPARTEAEIIAAYSADPTYAGIDVAFQFGKMRNWGAVNNKEVTERRFVNWLNRCERPLPQLAPFVRVNLGNNDL